MAKGVRGAREKGVRRFSFWVRGLGGWKREDGTGEGRTERVLRVYGLGFMVKPSVLGTSG